MMTSLYWPQRRYAVCMCLQKAKIQINLNERRCQNIISYAIVHFEVRLCLAYGLSDLDLVGDTPPVYD